MVGRSPTSEATRIIAQPIIDRPRQRAGRVNATMVVPSEMRITAKGTMTAKPYRALPFVSNGHAATQAKMPMITMRADPMMGAAIRGMARRRWMPIATPPATAPATTPATIATQPDAGALPSIVHPIADARYRMATKPPVVAAAAKLAATHRD